MKSLAAQARWAGVIYLLMSLVGAPTLLMLPQFISPNDAAVTAENILAREGLYRLLVLGQLAGSILFIVLGWQLYHLFENVDRKYATLLFGFVLASGTIGVIDAALLWGPMVLLHNAGYLSSFTSGQVETLSLVLLKLRSAELHADEAFWGLWLIPFGVLVIRCHFIPKTIGVLLLLASTGYLAMSAVYFGFPPAIEGVNRVAGVLIQGELPIILWLVIFGARPREPAAVGQPAISLRL